MSNTQPKIESDGGLLIDISGETPRAVGYLFDFQNKAFSPDGIATVGDRQLTKDEIETHNRLLAEGELKGLDEACQIGQYGTFFYTGNKVTTWTGVTVSVDVTVNGKSITFRRNGRTFRGRLQKDADCFNFKRVK